MGAILTMLAVVPKAGHDAFLESLLNIMHTAAARGVTKADLVFLSDDPQRVDPDAIADIIVTQTRLAGAPVAP